MVIKYILTAAACVGAVALTVIAVMLVKTYAHSNKKSATLEGKIIPDSRRIIWRIVNNGVRNISIVEIGLRCAEITASYRPLYSATEDINNIPHILGRGEIASYRKEMERFMFRQSEVDQLKISNPYVYYYAKDAEGTVYSERSEYKFVQYLTMLIGGNK